MEKYSISLNLWQWACLVDFLSKVLDTVNELPFPSEYKCVERAMESLVKQYLAAHELSVKSGKISTVTRGPALLLDKQVFKAEFDKSLTVGLEISATHQFRLEGYFGGVIRALKHAPTELKDAQYEEAVKESLQSILKQINR